MAEDKRQGSKPSKNYDRNFAGGTRLDTATFIGIVKDNYDPTRCGRLQVWIPDFGGTENETTTDPSYWRTVSYASPFFGSTFIPSKTTENRFKEVNHTYGMWMVPPDIGNQVLCTFVNGDPSRGYWFACINPTLSHNMVPGIASHPKTDKTQLDSGSELSKSLSDSPTQVFPTAEFNENDGSVNENFYNNPRPIHEYQAEILIKQGLDTDPVRGAITSSSQRESPSHVFGISTPGRSLENDPADDPDFQWKLQAGLLQDIDYAVHSRKGGHQFVMDDGDQVGVDQLIRLRTATGHQLLMNDREKTMYIANSEGTAWIELAGSGHMHIYTSGGFNLHTEGDVNMHSGQSINMHAAESVNIFGQGQINLESSKINISAKEDMLLYGGRTRIGAGSSMTIGAGTLKVGTDGAIQIDGSSIDFNSYGGGNSIEGISIPQNKHSDTGYTAETGLWREIASAESSITSVLPQHEPWTRSSPIARKPLIGEAQPKTVGDPNCTNNIGGGVPDYSLPAPNTQNLDRGAVKGYRAPWSTDTTFLNKVKTVASQLNTNYMDILAFMYHETSGTMDPAIVNNIGATGLIQFMPETARWLGTTTQSLAQLSRVNQLDWVLKYFNKFDFTSKAPNPKLQDLYLCVFWPAAIGKSDSYVIAAAGSNVAVSNKSLQAPNGSITCASVGAAVKNDLPIIKQILANAGITNAPPDGILTTTDGTPVTDGFGNPVRTGSGNSARANINQGPKEAYGKSMVGGNCPIEWLSRNDAWEPSGGIGTNKPKLTQRQVKSMMAELGYMESTWDYGKVSSDSTKIGKYQEDAKYLSEGGRAYIKPDAVTQYTSAEVFSHNESWTNKDKIDNLAAFLNATNIQDELQYQEFLNYYNALLANGGLTADDDVCIAAGMLFVAHYYRSPDLAKQWRSKGGDSTANNYFNHGRYAIDVLAMSVGMSGTSALSAALNPDLGTVVSANGAKAQVAKQFVDTFQSFINDLEASGYKITSLAGYADRDIRGIPGVKSAHAYGAAIDINPLTNPLSQKLVTDMPIDTVRTLIAKYGIGWGGNWPTRKDAMHFSMLKSEGGSSSLG